MTNERGIICDNWQDWTQFLLNSSLDMNTFTPVLKIRPASHMWFNYTCNYKAHVPSLCYEHTCWLHLLTDLGFQILSLMPHWAQIINTLAIINLKLYTWNARRSYQYLESRICKLVVYFFQFHITVLLCENPTGSFLCWHTCKYILLSLRLHSTSLDVQVCHGESPTLFNSRWQVN